MFKRLLKALLPTILLSAYHYVLALFSAVLYRRPSKKMVVIGVTGTSGKSTTCYLLARMLEETGATVGMASTILFKVAEEEELNDKKMTMVGRFQLQRLLKRMCKAKCHYAIVETTSEGIKQFRHLGIHYDVCVFTNLYKEHLESHGGFANYKAAKLKLFQKLEKDKHKFINEEKIHKVIVGNQDDDHVADFLDFTVDEKILFGVNKDPSATLRMTNSESAIIEAMNIKVDARGISFELEGVCFEIPILGEHNVRNVLAALAVGRSQGLSLGVMAKALTKVSGIPGRIEKIDEGQDFTVIVDYAFEPGALSKLYQVVDLLKPNRVIQVTGATGGGRDTDKRPEVGRMVAERAAVTIVTNEDPYDEDPQKIIDEVAAGAQALANEGKTELLQILDRGAAIRRAISLAQTGDLVLITGKGSEGAMAVANGKLIPWDDREMAREALRAL